MPPPVRASHHIQEKRMNISRRSFGAHATGVAVGTALAACGSSGADTTTKPKAALLLIHGSWLGSWSYADLIVQLQGRGVAAFAPDLPGHALGARFPASFLSRPLNQAAFSTEGSPLAGVSLADYVASILAAVDRLAAQGYGSITVLGHSMGGIPITAAAEKAPSKIAKLIYLSAFLPVTAAPAANYLNLPENSASQIGPLLQADPSAVGALRLDTGSTDATYTAKLKTMFCADALDAEFPAIAHMMQPDDPIQAFATPTGATKAGWGSVPRAYIGCTQDNLIPPALQKLFVKEADMLAATATDFRTFDSSHAGFFGKPAELATLIASLVAV
jgi:pimeloyl-ACP methyl ester carboxylesterase